MEAGAGNKKDQLKKWGGVICNRSLVTNNIQRVFFFETIKYKRNNVSLLKYIIIVHRSIKKNE